MKATSPRTTIRTGNEATTESNTIVSSNVPSNIKRIRRSDTNEDNAGKDSVHSGKNYLRSNHLLAPAHILLVVAQP